MYWRGRSHRAALRHGSPPGLDGDIRHRNLDQEIHIAKYKAGGNHLQHRNDSADFATAAPLSGISL